MSKRILLIGGGGFIGHHLAQALSVLDNEVFVLDSFEVNNFKAKLFCDDSKRCTDFLLERANMLKTYCSNIYTHDARDYHKVSQVVEDCKPEIIIHLAAVSHANKSNKDPHSTFDHSFRTLENALDAAKSEINVGHFIYFSSSMVYGNFTSNWAEEGDKLNPIGIYGALKKCGEILVKSYGDTLDLPYTIIRPSALYGPRCVSRRVIQAFIENILDGKEIKVQGDGSDKLDFTYIDDLVQGIVKVIGNKKAIGGTFNITYGEGRSINDLINILRKELGFFDVAYIERDKLMPKRGSLSIEKARKLLGYNPKYKLERGVPEYVRWYKTCLGRG